LAIFLAAAKSRGIGGVPIENVKKGWLGRPVRNAQSIQAESDFSLSGSTWMSLRQPGELIRK
jgi:hypothetical protein